MPLQFVGATTLDQAATPPYSYQFQVPLPAGTQAGDRLYLQAANASLALSIGEPEYGRWHSGSSYGTGYLSYPRSGPDDVVTMSKNSDRATLLLLTSWRVTEMDPSEFSESPQLDTTPIMFPSGTVSNPATGAVGGIETMATNAVVAPAGEDANADWLGVASVSGSRSDYSYQGLRFALKQYYWTSPASAPVPPGAIQRSNDTAWLAGFTTLTGAAVSTGRLNILTADGHRKFAARPGDNASAGVGKVLAPSGLWVPARGPDGTLKVLTPDGWKPA